ncbi:MAG: hypothetical protein JWO40_90 [Candidatus Doudnabacteria bacterium]|nr:hypothetical protein [Candidatus Doudnabacteria bacterium]
MTFKKLVLSLCTVLFSGLGWYFFSRVFTSASVLTGNGLNWTLFFVFLAMSYAFLFVVALTKDRYDFILTTLLSAIWIVVFLGPTWKNLLSAAVMFLSSQVLWEFPSALERSLNLKYYSVSYSKIALVILAVIGISSAYLQTRLAESVHTQSFSQGATNFAWPYVGKYLSQFNSGETVNKYLADQFKEQGINNPSPSMLNAEKKQISQQVGFDVNGDEKMSDVGKQFVAFRLNDIVKEFNVDKAGIFVIFVSLLVIWPIGRFLFAFVAMILYYIFKKLGVLHVTESQVITKKLEF